MLPKQAVYVHHSRGGGSDLSIRRNAENTTVVAAAVVDPAAAAAAFARLFADPALCRRLGAAGRRRVLERFTWAGVIRAYEELWRGQEAERQARAARSPAGAAPRRAALLPRPGVVLCGLPHPPARQGRLARGRPRSGGRSWPAPGPAADQLRPRPTPRGRGRAAGRPRGRIEPPDSRRAGRLPGWARGAVRGRAGHPGLDVKIRSPAKGPGADREGRVTPRGSAAGSRWRAKLWRNVGNAPMSGKFPTCRHRLVRSLLGEWQKMIYQATREGMPCPAARPI